MSARRGEPLITWLDDRLPPGGLVSALVLNRLPKWAAIQLEAVREQYVEGEFRLLSPTKYSTAEEIAAAKARIRSQMHSVPCWGDWWFAPWINPREINIARSLRGVRDAALELRAGYKVPAHPWLHYPRWWEPEPPWWREYVLRRLRKRREEASRLKNAGQASAGSAQP